MHLGTLDSTWALCLGTSLTAKSPKKAPKYENGGTKQTTKKDTFELQELQKENRTLTYCMWQLKFSI